MGMFRFERLRVVPTLLLCLLVFGLVPQTAAADDCVDPSTLADRQLSRCDYADHLRAMWLGETIANWTGLTTEAVVQDVPFYTDADWGRDQNLNWKANDTIGFVFQDPWLSDDDTDIEYLYLDLMLQHDTVWLAPDWIAAGWVKHVNDPIWGGNGARNLLEWGVLPPVSGMSAVYPYPLLNDAQLITEMFGALAPGLPDYALWTGDLPIRVTSDGYGAQAAQFYIVLYSLATQVDPALTPREQNLWLVTQARQYFPATSKIADVVDFVMADYLANPDANDWERTRDAIYARYQQNPADKGFVYRGWRDSSINFATGIMAFLYGEGDFQRSVQIGTLSGWDSDNGTATIGGLLGLMHGYAALAAQFPDVALSDRYRIHQTRPLMPDYLPDDPAAEDTFTLMAEHMLPFIDQVILEAGGSVDGDVWTLPPISPVDPLSQNPLEQIYRRSANNRVRLAGGEVKAYDGETSNSRTSVIADGRELDFSGEESRRPPRAYSARAQDGVVTLSVAYDRDVEVQTIRLIEGDAGGFATLSAEVLVGDVWQPVSDATVVSPAPDPNQPYQMIDFTLPEAMQARGIRVTGSTGGVFSDVSVLELDALSAPDSFAPAGSQLAAH